MQINLKIGDVLLLIVATFASVQIHGEEEFIDLTTFTKYRTHQYPLPFEKRISLNSCPRTGSTLVYNILRFLFEDEDQKPWAEMHSNKVIKNHTRIQQSLDMNYIIVVREPINTFVSQYRVHNDFNPNAISEEILEWVTLVQLDALRHINKLMVTARNILLLRYEEFASDFDFLFKTLENHFCMTIENEDKSFLKKALSKNNILKNIEPFTIFGHYDDYSHYHGKHLDQGEMSQEFRAQLEKTITERIAKYSYLYQRVGYLIPSDDTTSPMEKRKQSWLQGKKQTH